VGPDLRIVPHDLWEQVKARRAAMARDTLLDVVGDRPF